MVKTKKGSKKPANKEQSAPAALTEEQQQVEFQVEQR